MKQEGQKPEVFLTFFGDDREESLIAKRALKEAGERCYFYDVRTLHKASGDEIEVPTLYAPEGIFRGWKQIQTFLGIPSDMRFDALVP